MVMSGGMEYMIGMIRSLQMILHLPMMKIIVPGNVSMLFSAIIPIAMFDVLENDEINPTTIFDFDGVEEQGEDIFDQMRDLGYETHSSLLNLGTLFVFLFAYALKVLFFLVLWLFSPLSQKIRTKV